MSGRPGPPPRARSPLERCCSCHGHRWPRHLHPLDIDAMTPHRKRQVIYEWRISGHAAWRLNEDQSDFLRPQPEWCCCPCHPEDQHGRPPPAAGEAQKRKTRGPDKQPRKKRARTAPTACVLPTAQDRPHEQESAASPGPVAEDSEKPPPSAGGGSGAAPFADWKDCKARLQAWAEREWLAR